MNISELIPQIAIIVIAGSIYFSIKTIVAWMKRLEREFNVIYDKLDLVQKVIEDKTEKWAELEAAMDEINKETKITARRTEGKFDDEFSDKELKYIKKSMIEKIGSESNKEADDMAFDIINVCQELLGEPQFESVDEIVSFNF